MQHVSYCLRDWSTHSFSICEVTIHSLMDTEGQLQMECLQSVQWDPSYLHQQLTFCLFTTETIVRLYQDWKAGRHSCLPSTSWTTTEFFFFLYLLRNLLPFLLVPSGERTQVVHANSQCRLSGECWYRCEHPPKWHIGQGGPWHGQRCFQLPYCRGGRKICVNVKLTMLSHTS